MSSKSLITINLLKGRHKKESFSVPLLGSNRQILIKGIFPGSILILSMVFACILVTVQGNIYKQRKDLLHQYALKYDNYTNSINKAKSKIKKLYENNKKLARSIAGLRSGSAILTEISQIIPRSLTLDEVIIEDYSIILTGIVEYPYGLKDINIFILQLEDSPFIKKYSTKLSHALELKDNTSISQDEISPISKNKLKFTINSELNPDTSEITSVKLEELGSFGLAHRLKLLQEEELLND